jgi:predicted transcriptional regulator/transcriptional regulator with XRE-family HTH domain
MFTALVILVTKNQYDRCIQGLAMQEKILVGHKLRRFRQSIGLSQTAMAEALEISPSYLNLLEHNQRPLTVGLLLKLGNNFDIDLKDFAEDDSANLSTGISEIFADPLLAGDQVPRREIQDMITAAPTAARGLIALYQAYRKVRDELELTAGDSGGGIKAVGNPVEKVRAILQQSNNYFPQLEEAAEELRAVAKLETTSDFGLTGDSNLANLAGYVAEKLNLRTRIMPVEVMRNQLRRYDLHRREILLSEALRRPQRQFHLLVQIALLSQQDLLDDICDANAMQDQQAVSLFKITLAGYFAGAVMMPYNAFLDSAKSLRYDLELLGRRFGCSFEQVCHRLTTLNAPNARGIPFFFIRVDDAGNISKRLAAAGMQFATHGGTCPKWIMHRAFRTPEKILAQVAEMPNGQKYFMLARTAPPLWSPTLAQSPDFAVTLGCELTHARDMIYADQIDLSKNADPDLIGVGCTVCERMDCTQRAHPPIGHELRFDGPMRRIGLYDLATKSNML